MTWLRDFPLALFLLVLSLTTESHAARFDGTFHSPMVTSPVTPRQVSVASDDSFFLYNNFDRLGGANLGALIKFAPNGSYDPSFRVKGRYFQITATTLLPNGQILAAVDQRTKRDNTYAVVRLLNDGSIDSTFATKCEANSPIYAMASQSDGKILVGGIFTSFNGDNRPFLVRLNSDGSVDSSFAQLALGAGPNFSKSTGLRALGVQTDGKILIAGTFSSVGGNGRNQVARLLSDGTLDQAFVSNTFGNYPNDSAAEPIRAVVCDTDGSVLVAGRFRSTSVTPLIRLGGTDGDILQFFPGRSSSPRPIITQLTLLANRDILGVGDRLYKFSAAGGTIAGYQTNLYSQAYGLAVQSDGHFLVVGDLQTGVGFIRYAANGSADSLALGPFQREQNVERIGVRSDGGVWIGASAGNLLDGAAWNGTARLDPDGNAIFRHSIFGSGFALDNGNRVVLFGYYSPFSYDLPTSYLRLLTDNSRDNSFQTDPNGPQFTDLIGLSDGSYLGSEQLSVKAVASNAVMLRLLPTGLSDSSFHFGVNFPAEASILYENGREYFVGDTRVLATYADGKFLARYFDATGSYRLKRFTADGSIDSTFLTGTVTALTRIEGFETYPFNGSTAANLVMRAPGTPFNAALLLPDGRILVGGMFDHYNGVPAPGIVRLQSDGSVDPTFHPGSGAEWRETAVDSTHLPRVDAITRLADGRLLITGDFEAYDGHAAPGIARLFANGARDPDFYPPVVLQPMWDSFSNDLDNVGVFPVSQLVTQASGSVLLMGNFAPAQTDSVRSLVRLTGLTDALVDTDGDGMPDDFETQFFGSATAADPSADSDHDGKTNLEEYLCGTDPTNPHDYLRVETVRAQGGDILITFRAVAGKSYRIDAGTSVTGSSASTIAVIPASPSDRTVEVSDSGGLAQGKKFYRVVLVTAEFARSVLAPSFAPFQPKCARE